MGSWAELWQRLGCVQLCAQIFQDFSPITGMGIRNSPRCDRWTNSPSRIWSDVVASTSIKQSANSSLQNPRFPRGPESAAELGSAKMLSFQTPAVYQSSKCFVTYGTMGHLDPKQPPSKGKPWATLASQDFVHSVRLFGCFPLPSPRGLIFLQVDLIVPAEAYDAVQEAIAKRPAPEFRSVVMSLREVLAGDFFTEYVKKGISPNTSNSLFQCLHSIGDIMMLSQGRVGIDNVYSLKNGMLSSFPLTWRG